KERVARLAEEKMMTTIAIESALEIRHYGAVRGAANAHARLHLSICVPEIENPTTSSGKEEMKALFAPWDEAFSLVGSPWVGWDYRINTRREFAVIPTIIRKAQVCGFDVKVS